MSDNAEVRSLSQLAGAANANVLHVSRANGEGSRSNGNRDFQTDSLVSGGSRGYWRQQLTESERWLNECREALMRCQATVRADEKRPCTDERKRVEKAQARRNLCDEKTASRARCDRPVAAASRETARPTSKHSGYGRCRPDGDVNHLDKIIATLEAYTNLRS